MPMFRSPVEMQGRFAARAQVVRAGADEPAALLRVVADYIAGMTDRFASREHERLTGRRLLASRTGCRFEAGAA